MGRFGSIPRPAESGDETFGKKCARTVNLICSVFISNVVIGAAGIPLQSDRNARSDRATRRHVSRSKRSTRSSGLLYIECRHRRRPAGIPLRSDRNARMRPSDQTTRQSFDAFVRPFLSSTATSLTAQAGAQEKTYLIKSRSYRTVVSKALIMSSTLLRTCEHFSW